MVAEIFYSKYYEVPFIASNFQFLFVSLRFIFDFEEIPIGGSCDIPLLIFEVVFHLRLSSFTAIFTFCLVP